ncbi:ABC transporter permease [Chitinophaga barathri]|uniref:FtsX-like permease family protein n=1 Tax=Chitinophaga barathri TaxID=1647451 RepID=A0A3N4MJJ3_9BACT|nr:ABC transporter permease [Chitinophaga barathri]RPD42037.1 FtsX-like permease family protein [Chitinophaga barathri]
MFRNHFKIALRNCWKYRTYTGINLAGLAIGLAACWILLLYVGHELSYERFHEKGGRIYRVASHASWPGNTLNMAKTSVPFGPALQQDNQEIEMYTRIDVEGGGLLTNGTRKVEVGAAMYVDSTFLQMFSFPLLAGDAATALKAPNSVVITETLARKFFNDPLSAMGKQLTWNKDYPETVTGVLKDIPKQSHLKFEALRSMPAGFTGGWQDFSVYTYLALRPGADVKQLEAKLPAFYPKYLKTHMGEGVSFSLELQPLNDIHLHSQLDYEMGPNSNARTVYIFSLIAALILFIACINYMNISTARASVRVREVGVRKSLGSGRGQIARLFLTESVLITLIAAILAAILTSVALPVFNNVSGMSLGLWNYGIGYTLLALFVFAILVGLLAGAYPALFMAGFHTITALKGRLNLRFGNAAFRKGLVTFQFAVAIVLIAASIVTWRQMQFVNGKNLGFAKDQVITFHLHDRALRERIPAIREELKKSPWVQDVAAVSNVIGTNYFGSNGFKIVKNGVPQPSLMTQEFQVDEHFLSTMDIPLVRGRNFSKDRPGERYTTILINETMAKELGPEDPLGQVLQYTAVDTIRERRIIGIVKDFHIYSLQHKIAPAAMMMAPVPSMEDNLYLRLDKTHLPEALRHIEKVYASFEKNYPLEYHFLDENFSQQYKMEHTQRRIFLAFTGLAIFIACMGLFGLAAFTAEQRTKEIGVRKVLGASVAHITALLTTDFLRLVLISVVIAIPLAWWAMQYWLNDFAYRVNLSWWMFAAAGASALLIAFLTVGYQAVRAAMANPADTLKTE